MRRLIVVLAFLALAAGCGKSGVTKKGYAKKANAICARYTKKVNALQLGAPTKREMLRLLGRTVQLVRRENAALRGLQAPSAERKDVSAMLGARDALADVFAQNENAIADYALSAATGGGGAAKARARLQALLGPPQARAKRLTEKLGLGTCARELKS